jgi:hypothetical protein
MVPLPLNPDDSQAKPRPVAAPARTPALAGWVRGTLVGIALGLIALFCVAAWLNPYQKDGSARRMETHRQLGLPECTFKKLTGIPCPSCGMTTSFALTIRGDLVNAAQANCVGMLLALALLAIIPWCVGSAIAGRTVFVRSVERTVMVMVIGLLALMLLRWGVYLGLAYWLGAPPRF